MRNSLIHFIAILLAGLSCSDSCHYRDVTISTKVNDYSARVGDTLSLEISLSCGKKCKIAVEKVPQANLFVVTDSGAKIVRKFAKSDDVGYDLRMSPVLLTVKSVVERNANGLSLLFIETRDRIRLNDGLTKLTLYYHPPQQVIGWSDSDEGHPSVELGLNVVE